MDPVVDPDGVRQNLQYLRDHRVCETLENITKALLQEKPKAPIETILRVLRTSNITPRGIGSSQGGRRQPQTGLLSASQQQQQHNTHQQQPMNLAGYLAQQQQQQQQPSASISSVSVTTTKGFENRGPGTPAAIGSTSGGLPRDESLASDASAFSIQSVDMGEFLVEFNQAYNCLKLTKELRGYITRADIVDLLDLVVLPTPDPSLLESMFSELDTTNSGKVLWEVFLARMNYRIQGKHHTEVLKMIFNTETKHGIYTLDLAALTNCLSKLGYRRTLEEVSTMLKTCGVCGPNSEPSSCTYTSNDFSRLVTSIKLAADEVI